MDTKSICYRNTMEKVKSLHLEMDGDRNRDPHWSTGLSSQGPDEEQKEGEHEQGSQDREG
ncbi:hypothetical protein LEMLEM_LOCUS3208, partial [Lemmus lemmus]